MIQKLKLKLNWKYALGEVFLIFLGITMAFGLQQWANSKSEFSKSKRYLDALNLELESNLEVIKSHRKSTQEDADKLRYYIELVNSDSSHLLKESDIIEMVQNLGPSYYLSLSIAAYQDIINSGGIEYISDPVIRRNLIRYGVFLTEYESRVANSLDRWHSILSPYYQRHADLSKMSVGGITFDFSKELFESDLDAFVRNRDFTNILRSRIIWQLSVVKFIDSQIEDLDRFNGQVKNFLSL